MGKQGILEKLLFRPKNARAAHKISIEIIKKNNFPNLFNFLVHRAQFGN